jgi:hypothetical protein
VDFLAPIVAPAAAQALMRLHVRSFTLTAEPQSLRVGDTLKLRIAIRVDENVLQLSNVTLPDLSGFDSLGDERQCASAGHGTQCLETMTLSPTVPGDRTIGPTTLDAIDARTNKPSRFATNAVMIHVAALPGALAQPLFRNLVKPILILVLVGAAAYALLWNFGRRSRRSMPIARPQPETPRGPAPPQDPLPGMIAALRADRARARVNAIRDELRRRVGAKEEETLADLLARRAAGDNPNLADALRAIERAAFVDDADLEAAIDDALPILDRLTARTTPPTTGA